jgi:hypothetical protein
MKSLELDREVCEKKLFKRRGALIRHLLRHEGIKKP